MLHGHIELCLMEVVLEFFFVCFVFGVGEIAGALQIFDSSMPLFFLPSSFDFLILFIYYMERLDRRQIGESFRVRILTSVPCNLIFHLLDGSLFITYFNFSLHWGSLVSVQVQQWKARQI